MCKKKFNIKDEVLNNEDVKKKMNELLDSKIKTRFWLAMNQKKSYVSFGEKIK